MTLLHEFEFDQGFFQVFDSKPDGRVIDFNQTHSKNIVEFFGEELEGNIDGIIFDHNLYRGLKFAIKTADCLPVLFIGTKTALVHAGWRGLYNQILIDSKIQSLDIHTIYIGPSIHLFKVTNEFLDFFKDSKSFKTVNNQIFFNIQEEATKQLQKYYPKAIILNSNICTLKNYAYNSFRRDKTEHRNWNIFKIK